jgi:8-oxo-dGTP pyrophosphatase MutT (NUDIX family)
VSNEVQAAGGLVVKTGADGQKVLVVHRPRYDDWSLPKGKLDQGESLQQCALREVFEETGFPATAGRYLGIIEYTDRKGRPKEVHYWEMTLADEAAASEAFIANDEVDEIRWLSPLETAAILTYPRDTDVLAMAGLHADSNETI